VNPTKIGNVHIAIICIVGAIGVSIYTFAASRLDPGLRMAALVSMTNLAAALMATASTLLVGKTFGNTKAQDVDIDLPKLPPGVESAQIDTTGQTTSTTVTAVKPT
jgi:hypothetical protein